MRWLLTDLYQLTMAKAYWRAGVAHHESVFHATYRHNPFRGGFTIACGLDSVVQHIERARPDGDDLEYLAGLRGSDGDALFEHEFLDYLADFEPRVDVDAMPEGTVAFANEPLLRVTGPVLHCQLLESAISNLLNFQTLVATKAARVRLAAAGDPVIEFGLRRAQGPDAALAASRAAYLAGCAASSNVEAGRIWGIPIRGTHAHSSVMLFGDERAAFEAFARACPSDVIFLVDTYESLSGTRHAVEVARGLRARGRTLRGVRLDSGDLDRLSREVRRILDDGGFSGARIVASGDLDEHRIEALKRNGAPIDVWGVGTRLVTGHEEAALSGIFKLSAVRTPGGEWEHRVKASEEVGKSTIPGILQVRRFEKEGSFVGDAIYDLLGAEPDGGPVVDASDLRSWTIPQDATAASDVLVPVLRDGKRVGRAPGLEESRARARAQLASLPDGVKRLTGPDAYPAGLEAGLAERRAWMIAEARATALKGMDEERP